MQVGTTLVPSSAAQRNNIVSSKQWSIFASSLLAYLIGWKTTRSICPSTFHQFRRLTFLWNPTRLRARPTTRGVYCSQTNSILKDVSELNVIQRINHCRTIGSSTADSSFAESIEKAATYLRVRSTLTSLKNRTLCAGYSWDCRQPEAETVFSKKRFSKLSLLSCSHVRSELNCSPMEQPTTRGFFPQIDGEPSLEVTSGSHPIVDMAYEKVLDALTTVDDPRLKDFSNWLRRIVEYNVPEGKRNRLVAVMLAYQLLEKDIMTEVKLEKAAILGWCVELLQAYFLICDDIMDNSVTRRGKKCWYLVEDVQMMAINDALLLKTGIYRVLKTFFRDHPYYLDLMELFQEVSCQTSQGQCLDMLSERQGSGFTEERYNAIVLYKTAYYSFSLPIRLGMYLAGIADGNSHKKAEAIALRIGHIFQIQDDFLDCYGLPDIIGKVGTDIVDSKCSWLVVKALQIATSDQKKVLLENYGKGKPGGLEEAAVKKIYDELDMISIFRQAEERAFSDIRDEVIKLENSTDSTALTGDIFKLLANKIYQRIK